VKSNDKKTCKKVSYTIFVLEMGRGSFETSILAKEIISFYHIVMIVQLFQYKVGERFVSLLKKCTLTKSGFALNLLLDESMV
jgi:hypothetical protein